MMSLPQALFWIAIRALPLGLGFFLLPVRCTLNVLDEVVVRTTLLSYHICLPGESKSSFSESSPLRFVVTLVLGKMLDVARHEQYGGKLHHLCHGWYV
jgi:hypothetical protein